MTVINRRRRRFWQGDMSLDASRRPHVPERIRRGRRHPAEDPTNAEHEWAIAALAADLGVGFMVESAEEARRRNLARGWIDVMAPAHVEFPEREAEAVGLYLWGKHLPAVQVLWEAQDFDGIGWAIMAEHPPWKTLAAMARPTRHGNPVEEGNLRRTLKRAAAKLQTDVPGLREKALEGLVRIKARAAWTKVTPDQQRKLRRRYKLVA